MEKTPGQSDGSDWGEGEGVMDLARPNDGLRYKRFSLGVTKEMDDMIIKMNGLPGFRSCTYADCIRILIDQGLEAMKSRFPEIDVKS